MKRNQHLSMKKRNKVVGRIRLVICLLLLVALVVAAVWLVKKIGAESQPEEKTESSAVQVESEALTASGTENSKQDPEQMASSEEVSPFEQSGQQEMSEQEIIQRQVTEAAQQNVTKDQAQIFPCDEWNANAENILTQLGSDPYYANYGFNIDYQQGYPYFIAVNRAASTVTVYTADETGRYTVPFMAMVCSGGNDTPLGYWATPVSYDWRLLSGPCYGQYATRIWDAFLFHSVPYYTQHQDDVEYDQFNQLGTLASLGCIRLAVADVKWIYDNCPIGTPVVIYDDAENPGPMGKPGTIYTDPTDLALRGWDPTDPNPENPWPESYRSGTAIRSPEALSQWDEMSAVWAQSINPASLQGFSTDSGVEGTRG